MTRRSQTPTFAEVYDPRANGLNFVRLILASGVIVWHSIPLTGHEAPAWPLAQLLGRIWVDGFFAISGFLIVASWMRDPSVIRYLAARVLRIFPAFWVCLVVTAFVVAPLATGVFSSDNVSYVTSNAALSITQWGIAGTLTDVPYPDVWNGSLWTLFWEFLCYLAVLLLGVMTLLRRAWTLPLAFAIAVLAVAATAYGPVDNFWVANGARFAVMFLAGALVYQFRDRIPVSLPVTGSAALVLAGSLFLPDYGLIAAPALAYLVMVAGAVIRSERLRFRDDISYGMYIYAFPVQQLLALAGLRDYVPFVLASIVLTALPAAASWFFIEKPVMRLRRRLRPRGHSDASKNRPFTQPGAVG